MNSSHVPIIKKSVCRPELLYLVLDSFYTSHTLLDESRGLRSPIKGICQRCIFPYCVLTAIFIQSCYNENVSAFWWRLRRQLSIIFKVKGRGLVVLIREENTQTQWLIPSRSFHHSVMYCAFPECSVV